MMFLLSIRFRLSHLSRYIYPIGYNLGSIFYRKLALYVMLYSNISLCLNSQFTCCVHFSCSCAWKTDKLLAEHFSSTVISLQTRIITLWLRGLF